MDQTGNVATSNVSVVKHLEDYCWSKITVAPGATTCPDLFSEITFLEKVFYQLPIELWNSECDHMKFKPKLVDKKECQSCLNPRAPISFYDSLWITPRKLYLFLKLSTARLSDWRLPSEVRSTDSLILFVVFQVTCYCYDLQFIQHISRSNHFRSC